MNKKISALFFTFIMMTTILHVFPRTEPEEPSFFETLYYLFFGVPQKTDDNKKSNYNSSNDNDYNLKIEDYITQFRRDTEQLPQKEIDEIVKTIRKELFALARSKELDNTTKASQIIRSVTIRYIVEKTYNEAVEYTQDEQERNKIRKSIEANVTAQLKYSDFNSYALCPYFGLDRRKIIKSPTPPAPTPSKHSVPCAQCKQELNTGAMRRSTVLPCGHYVCKNCNKNFYRCPSCNYKLK